MKKFFTLAILVAVAVSAIHAVQAPITSTPVTASSSRLLTNASVTLVNSAGALSYRAIFILNGNETSFLFPASGSTTHSSVLPPGTYTVAIAPIGGSSAIRNFSYSIGPDGGSQTGTSATFNNVSITSGSTVTVRIN